MTTVTDYHGDARDLVEVSTVGDRVRLSIDGGNGITTATLTMPVDTARWLVEELDRAARRASQ